jgi:DNA-directed RNA polymerase subunit RPC12/RpoP
LQVSCIGILQPLQLATTGWKLNLQSAAMAGPSGNPRNSKTKFTCSSCGQNIWGKPDTAVRCDHCDIKMVAATKAELGSYDQEDE